ncbi:MAG: hypothetical protein V3V08_25760 [Nannocystaceae bacterium]
MTATRNARNRATAALAAAGPGALLCLAGACQDDSFQCLAAVEDIRMAATIVDDDLRVEAEIKLWALHRSGIEIPMALCSSGKRPDHLRINGEDVDDSHAQDHPIYLLSLDAPSASYKIELYRGGNNVTITTRVEAPPGLTITLPGGEQISRSADVELRWTPIEREKTLQVVVERDDLSCLQRFSADVRDKGQAIFAAPWPALVEGASTQRQCDGDLVLTRTSVGTYPGELRDGGIASAITSRRMRFRSIP